MDLTFSEKEIAYPRRAARVLSGNHRRRPDRRRRGRALPLASVLARRLYDAAGCGLPAWPTEYGGRGALAERVGDLLQELAARAVPLSGQRGRPAAGRTDVDGGGHRRAGGALSLADPLGRGDLVPRAFSEPRRLLRTMAALKRAPSRMEDWSHRAEVWTSGAHTQSGACSSPRTRLRLAQAQVADLFPEGH